MNDLQCGIISLIKSAITSEAVSLPNSFDWHGAMRYAEQHHIGVLLYYGAHYSKIRIPDDIQKQLELHVFRMVNLDAKQEYQLKHIYRALDDANIDYLPLKGAVIKSYYPNSTMRYMGDADLLIRTDQYETIQTVLIQNGFTFVIESNHEYVWQKGVLHLELHKYLIPSYNKDYFDYYGTGWQLAKVRAGHQYQLNDEDFLIYLFTHLAKHYRDSGVGIKHFVDIWLYMKAKPALDDRYIRAELKKLQLLDFYENCLALLQVWFEHQMADEKTVFMTNWIFASGAYGTKENHARSVALKKTLELKHHRNVQKKIWLSELFPPLQVMKKRYDILNRLPVLLPVMWLVRGIQTVLFKRDKLKAQRERLSYATQENVEAYEQALQYVGLAFHFQEKKS